MNTLWAGTQGNTFTGHSGKRRKNNRRQTSCTQTKYTHYR